MSEIYDIVRQTRMFAGDTDDEALDAAIDAWREDERFPTPEDLVGDEPEDGGWDEQED